MKPRYFTRIDSPVGKLLLVASDDALHRLEWDKSSKAPKGMDPKPEHPVLARTKKQLDEYFDRKRTNFDIPLSVDGTDFQKKAWKQLSKIPYGKTISYSEQAKRLGDPKKCRAVGGANGKNPISIIVPCHRVVGKDGSLTGFGGGVPVKRYLLELESR